MATTRILISLPTNLKERAAALAARRGESFSALVRGLLARELQMACGVVTSLFCEDCGDWAGATTPSCLRSVTGEHSWMRREELDEGGEEHVDQG